MAISPMELIGFRNTAKLITAITQQKESIFVASHLKFVNSHEYRSYRII